jgi:hypothetical protein
VVSARDGGRPVVPRQSLEPKIAMQGLAQLHVPAVRDAVREVLSGDRLAVQRHSEQLRGELAVLEAALHATASAPDGLGLGLITSSRP